MFSSVISQMKPTTRAAAAGDGDASAYRDIIAAGMAQGQIMDAERLVNQWKLEHPGNGLLGY